MREINSNNINKINFKGLQKASNDGNIVPETPVVPEETETMKDIKDLGNMPAATIGKSQVSATDSLENDMKFLEKNPQLAQALNEAIDKYAETHTEEETIKMIEKAHQEFVAKK